MDAIDRVDLAAAHLTEVCSRHVIAEMQRVEKPLVVAFRRKPLVTPTDMLDSLRKMK